MESSSSPTQHILQLEDQLREKEKDVELAATIGQDLLNQVALLNSRVKELEAQRESTSTNNDNTTPKQQHPISKIPLPSSSNSSNPKKTVPNPPSVPQQQQLPHQQQQQHQQQQHQQHPNPTGSPFPRTPSKSKLLSNQLPPSPSTPATPLPYPEHKMDPNLAAQIENALVLQLRSLQAKLSTSESLRSKVSERCEAFERECTTIRSQNEKLANSERKLNERIWDLEILNQQLQETNETLEKEIARLLQKIKSQERDTSNMKDHVDALRLAEAGWNKEKETLLFKMESESSRKRREIAILKREKAELEKQIQELNQPMSVVEGGFQYKTGGSAASSTSDLARRAKSLEKLSDGKDDGEARSLQQQLQCQQQQQNSNNLFVNSLSKALSQAHTHNEELRRENADLLQSNEELDRLLQEAHETIESMKVGCDLSSLDRDQVFDPSFAVNQSVNLHDQLASSESMEDLLKFDLNLDLDKVQLPPTNLLAELTQADIDLAPAAEAMDSTEALPTAVVESNDLEPSDTVIEALSSRSHHQPIMSDFCCQTDDIPRFLLDTRSILNELTEIESIAPPPLPPAF
ncbi:hypothetical protein BDR26DRAFT_457832 [Obelidium mucronatum]|nr:hypothetical protein BDR26DRAFT_457832 [Obelidium mucronatum]